MWAWGEWVRQPQRTDDVGEMACPVALAFPVLHFFFSPYCVLFWSLGGHLSEVLDSVPRALTWGWAPELSGWGRHLKSRVGGLKPQGYNLSFLRCNIHMEKCRHDKCARDGILHPQPPPLPTQPPLRWRYRASHHPRRPLRLVPIAASLQGQPPSPDLSLRFCPFSNIWGASLFWKSFSISKSHVQNTNPGHG